MRLQELGYFIRKARLAKGLTQDELAQSAGLSRTTMNQLENGVFPDIGVNKVQAILSQLGLTLRVEPTPRRRRPDFMRMACTSASVSYREKLTEGELVRALLTGRIPAGRRPHFRMLLDEAPAAVLTGMLEDIGRFTQPGRVARNLRVIAEALGSLKRTRGWLKNS